MSTKSENINGGIGCGIVIFIFLVFVTFAISTEWWERNGYNVVPDNTPIVFKFKKGEVVKLKGSNIRGVVREAYAISKPVKLEYWYWFQIRTYKNGSPKYNVRLYTNKQIGIDTASGHGFLGENQHNTPTFSVIETFEEFELEKR